ncbi:MAG: hypothetical protein AAGA48_32410 [Myxococcota bacterium]
MALTNPPHSHNVPMPHPKVESEQDLLDTEFYASHEQVEMTDTGSLVVVNPDASLSQEPWRTHPVPPPPIDAWAWVGPALLMVASVTVLAAVLLVGYTLFA